MMRWDLAEWLERLTVYAEVGFDPSILRHSGILGAADEPVCNTVHIKTIEKISVISCILNFRCLPRSILPQDYGGEQPPFNNAGLKRALGNFSSLSIIVLDP
jgi:hypothetical protein